VGNRVRLAAALQNLGDRLMAIYRWSAIATRARLAGVAEAERRLWILSMNSDPFLHPYLYGPMIASSAEDPESSVKRGVRRARRSAHSASVAPRP
jgi:hypothetical protein